MGRKTKSELHRGDDVSQTPPRLNPPTRPAQGERTLSSIPLFSSEPNRLSALLPADSTGSRSCRPAERLDLLFGQGRRTAKNLYPLYGEASPVSVQLTRQPALYRGWPLSSHEARHRRIEIRPT